MSNQNSRTSTLQGHKHGESEALKEKTSMFNNRPFNMHQSADMRT